MRKAALVIALAVTGTTLAGAMLVGTMLAQSTGEVTVTGFVTDTFCGRRGASEKHAEHARRAVASGVAQYAVYDEAMRKLYILDSQQTAAQYAGQRVKVTGTLTATLLRRAGQAAVYPERSRRARDTAWLVGPPSVAAGTSGQANGLRASAATPTAAIQGMSA